MSKETTPSTQKIALGTAVGAVEGAILGSSLGIAGSVAGAILGGSMAYAAESFGRKRTHAVTAKHDMKQDFTDTTTGTTHTIDARVVRTKKDVPTIEVPDALLSLHFRSFADATGTLRNWNIETRIDEPTPATDTSQISYNS